MGNVLYDFKTGVVDFLEFSGATPTTGPYDFTFVSRVGSAGSSFVYPTGESTFVNVRSAFLTTYASDPLLNNDQVMSIGYGWQKWVVPRNATAEIMVRGACGGHSSTSGSVLNQSTGLYTTGLGCRGGRGAKLSGRVKLNKGDILYILVGIRGWCQQTLNVGGHGGSASVVLKDNPSGAYTFSPLNRKVDVLIVAGGGGGAFDSPTVSNTPVDCGGDASFYNGTNTNAGTVIVAVPVREGTDNSSQPMPGPGLTGGFTVEGTLSTRSMGSILNGLPGSTTSSRAQHVYAGDGNWIAGSGWHAGGGGSGYSGGNTYTAGGGSGGTSYINPTHVEEIFRGYETNAAMNPFSIPGSVQILLPGKDEAEWFLARDAEGNKYWNPAQSKWALIPNQGELTPTDFETYGTVPLIGGFTGLIEGDVKFFCSTPYAGKSLTIDGLARTQLIKCNFEISLIQIDVFKSWNLNNLHNSVTIKVAVSVDHGLTYKILASNIWTNIDINNKELFYTQGILITDLNTIPNAKWKELGATNLRFAFIVHQTANYNKPVLTSIDLIADLLGSWRKALHGTNYDYEYIAPDTCKITINTAGDYKINYLDRVDE